jgi:hypothetical protein
VTIDEAQDIPPGTVVRWYSRKGGWRYGKFLRVVYSRRGSTGIKRPTRAVIERGGDFSPVEAFEVPLADVGVYKK